MPPFLRRFLRDEGGSIAVEGMLVLPMLVWAYVGVFVFFDAYRAQSINIKAGYTIGDIVSRESGYVTPEYMDSLYQVQGVLTDTMEPRTLRVSVVRYDEPSRNYVVRWSQARGPGLSGLPANSVVPASMRAQLPAVANDRRLIIAETTVYYEPRYDVGLNPFTFTDLTVTQPRADLSRVCWNSVNDGGTPATATC